jgi:putative endonuclease
VTWHVYIAKCADDSLYCGVAVDVAARIAAHDAGTGARYTRGRGPLVVVATRRCRDQGQALRLEHAIKQLTRAQKLGLDSAALRAMRVTRVTRVRRVRRRRAARRSTPLRA